ncbi:MAG: lipid-A-disaccharide synthase [Desulfobacula sp.]|nr:lipid-A-disaccharide synthase [Desulfobacula sp.]
MNLPVKFKHLMVLTGEPSGDLHAGNLIHEIKQSAPFLYISGIGGPNLQRQKVDLFFPISKLSAMGITEVLAQLGQIKVAFDSFKKKIRENKPDLIIVIDYPGFNLKAAQYAKEKYNIPILYYITPKVWAWKKSRLKKIKAYVDHAALILPFEEKIFKKANISATYVGNPLMDQYPEHLTKPFLRSKRKEHCHCPKKVIGLLPGSRKSEINSLLKIMVQASQLIGQNKRHVRFVISKAESVQEKLITRVLNQCDHPDQFEIHTGSVKDIFFKSDLLIAASGTVTLEAALCCVPTILIYKMSAISYRIAKILVKLEYAGLANLIVNRQVMPELIQYDATPERISLKARKMLDNLQYHENQLQSVRRFLGKKGASKRTARIALGMMNSTSISHNKFDKFE